ncbi:MAB_1171c family putative transporter [Nocardia sp. NPDC051052]|uniref:MAB_1171c family putative transporter n=1 Tax=Nocardia sp. NPDC051052 TaxID=3364322 RepID=UPI0037AF452E
MTPPVPIGIAAPVLVFAFAVVVSRWFLVRGSVSNRLVNRTLGWQTGAAVIFECGAGTEYSDVTYRIFLACSVMTAAGVYGIAALFAGDVDPNTARRRQRIYDVVAVVGAVIVVIVGRPADPMQPGFGWSSPLVWALFNLPIAAMAINVIRACVRELRVAQATTRERLVFATLFLVASYFLYCVVTSGLRVLGGQPSDSPPAEWTSASCAGFFAINVLLAVPVVNVLLARAGWDRTGRHSRRLFPLWRDLTAAVPGVVLDQGTGRRDPELRLYRILVEIQDALQHLRQYMPPSDRPEQSIDDHAVRIARAVDAKHRGMRPVAAGGHQYLRLTENRAAELVRLLELARVWRAARASASVDAGVG